VRRNLLVVRSDDDRDAEALLEIMKQCHELLLVTRVQVSNGPISDNHLRRVSERSRNGDTLLFATRESRREVSESMLEAHLSEQLARTQGAGFARGLAWNHRYSHALIRAQGGDHATRETVAANAVCPVVGNDRSMVGRPKESRRAFRRWGHFQALLRWCDRNESMSLLG
jgi:hypothetical protein